MSDETPEVWEGYVHDDDGEEWDSLTFSNPEAAEKHVSLTLETMTTTPADDVEFDRVNDRLQKAQVDGFTGYVVRPKVWDSVPETEEVAPDA